MLKYESECRQCDHCTDAHDPELSRTVVESLPAFTDPHKSNEVEDKERYHDENKSLI